jgi:hypothetical protein
MEVSAFSFIFLFIYGLSHRKHRTIKRGGLDELNGNVICILTTSYHSYTITQNKRAKISAKKRKVLKVFSETEGQTSNVGPTAELTGSAVGATPVPAEPLYWLPFRLRAVAI